MYNIHVFKYLRVSSKDQDYDYQRVLIDKDMDKLIEYVDSEPNLEIKDVIEVKEKASSTKRKQTKLDEMFKRVKTISSTNKESIFVILVSDHTRFMRSFLPFCDTYFSMRNSLGSIDELYNRFIIKFGYSDYSKFKDLFDYKSKELGKTVSFLIGLVQTEELNMDIKKMRIKIGVELSKNKGITKDYPLYKKKFLYELLTDKRLFNFNITQIARHFAVNRRSIYRRFEELTGYDVNIILAMLKRGQFKIPDDVLNKLKEFENSKASDGLTFDKNDFDIVKI